MITSQQYLEVANHLQVEISTIRAVHEVESAGSGFLPDGRLKLLFEGHVFWKQLEDHGHKPASIVSRHPQYASILYRKWTRKYYIGGPGEWIRMSRALELLKLIGADSILALNSASYGAFQIMGCNAIAAGYTDAQAMISHMNEGGEYEQLLAFCRYITNEKLVIYLRNKQFAKFAYHYNGSGYKGNLNVDWDDYDLKLGAADKKYS
jgi:N-acetylmuramidase-like protein